MMLGNMTAPIIISTGPEESRAGSARQRFLRKERFKLHIFGDGV